MDNQFVVVFITVPSREEGKKIATYLVERKLAACVNVLGPIESIYTWNGELTTDEEALLVVKTNMQIFEGQFIPAVKEIHPYDVPEIIALPILKGSKDYLDWIQRETSG
jgi:periplasmic divalent cation tolerance protein